MGTTLYRFTRDMSTELRQLSFGKASVFKRTALPLDTASKRYRKARMALHERIPRSSSGVGEPSKTCGAEGSIAISLATSGMRPR